MKILRSGLRGAVGLSLSLFVLLDNQISNERYRTLSLFFMGCTAFLTTLVQGTTMGPFLQARRRCPRLHASGMPPAEPWAVAQPGSARACACMQPCRCSTLSAQHALLLIQW